MAPGERAASYFHPVTRPTTVQALLEGGPADGAVRLVECGPHGRSAALLMLAGGTCMPVGRMSPSRPRTRCTSWCPIRREAGCGSTGRGIVDDANVTRGASHLAPLLTLAADAPVPALVGRGWGTAGPAPVSVGVCRVRAAMWDRGARLPDAQ